MGTCSTGLYRTGVTRSSPSPFAWNSAELWGFPGGTSGVEPACQCRRPKKCGFDPWVGGHDNPLQYSCLGNPKDRGACWATVHGVPQSQIWLKRLSMHTLLNLALRHLHSRKAPISRKPGWWVTLSMGRHTGWSLWTNPSPWLCHWITLRPRVLCWDHCAAASSSIKG